MRPQSFPVVLPVADLANALGTDRPERIGAALDVAVEQGVATLGIDTEGVAVVMLAGVVVERLGLARDGAGRWFTDDGRVAAARGVHEADTPAPPPERQEATAAAETALRAATVQDQRGARKRTQPRKPPRKPVVKATAGGRSFDLSELRAKLGGSEG